MRFSVWVFSLIGCDVTLPPEAWVAIALFVGGGHAVWMFRVDRGITRMSAKLEQIEKSNTEYSAETIRLWQVVSNHGERIASIEARQK